MPFEGVALTFWLKDMFCRYTGVEISNHYSKPLEMKSDISEFVLSSFRSPNGIRRELRIKKCAHSGITTSDDKVEYLKPEVEAVP